MLQRLGRLNVSGPFNASGAPSDARCRFGGPVPATVAADVRTLTLTLTLNLTLTLSLTLALTLPLT